MPKASASPPPRTQPRPLTFFNQKQNLAALAAIAVLLVCFYCLAWNASLSKSPTADEPLHFVGAWTQVHNDDFRTNPEDPPLWKIWAAAGTDPQDMKIAARSPMWRTMLKAEDRFLFSQITLYSPGVNVNGLFAAARARMTFIGVLLAIVIAVWAWRLAGPLAAVVATAAMTLDPNFLAHSPLVKNDVSMTLAFMLFMLSLWFVGEKVTVLRWISLAVTLGVALTVKFSGVLAFPMLAIALLVRIFLPQPWPMPGRLAITRLQRLGIATAIAASCCVSAYFFIWACYEFRFSPGTDPTRLFDQQSSMAQIRQFEALKARGAPAEFSDAQLSEWIADQPPSLVDRIYKWSDDNRILPQAFLRGFYYTWGRGLIRACYLLGEKSRTGWWYYFPLAMAFKTPLATLIALALATTVWLRWRGGASKWTLCATLLCPIFYAAAAIGENLNLGIRHIFPVYPFLFIFLGVAAALAWQHKPKPTAIVLAVLLIGLTTETLFAYPDFIPFFNVAAGGSRGGLYLLGDSNLDWGQDLPAIADWQKSNPDKQLFLRDFSAGNPRYYGINYANINSNGIVSHFIPQSPPLPAILAISATDMQGIYLNPTQQKLFERFMHEKPMAVLHGTVYLFDRVEDWINQLPKPAPASQPTTAPK